MGRAVAIGFVIPDCRQPQCQIDRGTACQRVAIGQQGGQRRRVWSGHGQHMRQTRMQRQRRQGASMRGDAAPGVKRAQHPEQRLRLAETAGVGRCQKWQTLRFRPPKGKFKRQCAQVGGLDLGGGEGG